MFFKIVALIQFILSLILEAEQRFSSGAGAEKKADVMKATSAELRRQGLAGPDDDTQPGNVLERAATIVDGLVELFNVTNTFKHEPSSSTATPATPEPEPLPVTPPATQAPNPPPSTQAQDPIGTHPAGEEQIYPVTDPAETDPPTPATPEELEARRLKQIEES